jgi:hypothetical protein
MECERLAVASSLSTENVHVLSCMKLKHAQLVRSEDGGCDVVAATKVEEAEALLVAGFERQLVPTCGIVFYRKPKRFSG